MLEYLYDLVELINSFDGSREIENKMRDLICYLSENIDPQQSELYRAVLFEAAEKLRVFGYIKGENHISVDEFMSDNLYDIRHQAVQNYYTSKVFSNNILDIRQKEIVDTFKQLEIKRILVSAPTSFGKTFILREILFLNQDRYRNILLVFPTIALLNENTDSIKELIKSLKADYKIINNVYSGIDKSEKHIFILTPERTLKLLSDNEDLCIDFFFFDEVYKIDEDFSVDEDSPECIKDKKPSCKEDKGGRAKAFRIALYLLSKRVKEFYLAGPYLNLDNLKSGLKKYIDECHITPIQIEFEPTMRVEIDAWKKGAIQKHPILGNQEVNLYDKGNLSTIEKILGITNFLKHNDLGQAIFYCSTPANSMFYVHKIIEALPSDDKSHTINPYFIEHLKKRYGLEEASLHVKNTADYWSLVKALENGYGIHHGKFPKYIQNEVLKMFNHGDFYNLFCTSTIIEGVNTNAKNVIIINNSVGNSTMSAFALRNIKGRAGRYYHHYIGRVFYTDAKQREIEQTLQLQLDFSTYNDVSLLNVDLDNAEMSDLVPKNKDIKKSRDKSLDFELLPENVFIKNRLFARDIQEHYLKVLMQKDEFQKFIPLIKNTGNIRMFLKDKTINTILGSFELAGILDSNKANVYHAVVSNYSISGTRGVISHHIKNHIKKEKEKGKDPLDTIDRAYINSFDQIRTIVEYEVPKLLCLFEAIFTRAATLNGYDASDFNMSSIIRFFELGITTEFGLSLVEFGFPVDTIKEIEKEFPRLSDLTTLEAVEFLRRKVNSDKVMSIIDAYEHILFRAAIRSFEK